ncbi:MAG: RidA family protein [Deltaproteobacteria bacterium]|nr:RidA family protein [Deltaproteobacteria bacterium]MBI2540222.1 RidA family protein [Deltaproteobacteria bacterium]MBI2990799.1 RidA family protein [Deltaproteobacteria bacterium]MBI3062129.1 RidA family protein [Deltaproteobacteria bacterium]
MTKKVIQPKTLNDPRPRYSQGILVTKPGTLLFIAGQTASDKDGNVVGKGDIEAQTHQVFRNLSAVLQEAGGSLDDLVMTTTYITDRKYREGYNRVRTQYYKKSSPTSTLVIITGLAHPDYLIEINGVAVL